MPCKTNLIKQDKNVVGRQEVINESCKESEVLVRFARRITPGIGTDHRGSKDLLGSITFPQIWNHEPRQLLLSRRSDRSDQIPWMTLTCEGGGVDDQFPWKNTETDLGKGPGPTLILP